MLFRTILEKLPLGFKPYAMDHVTYPEIDVLKKDVLGYYYMVSKVILPYVKDHPIHLIRYSNGVDKKPILDTSFRARSQSGLLVSLSMASTMRSLKNSYSVRMLRP